MSLVAWLNEVSEVDFAAVGGKAARLGRLARIGMRVPTGFVVTTRAFREFLRAGGLVSEIGRVLSSIDYENLSSLNEASSEVRRLIEGAEMPPSIDRELEKYRRELASRGVRYVAVRSSSVAEDLPTASFAGLQETYLFAEVGRVVEYVRRCWASLYTPRALVYRREKGIGHGDVAMAVVVQEMIDAEKSGVLFTAHPVTGSRDQVVIESVWGLGEGLVSGILTPDHYVVDKSSLSVVDRMISSKTKRIVHDRGGAGGTKEEEVPPQLVDEPTLSDQELRELAAAGISIEAHFGSPQDVEWCIGASQLYILQSRPITTI